MEQGVQQEQGVGRLRGHAADAGDVDVGAAGAVEEVDVEIDRLAVARQAGRQPPGHPIEVERLVAILAPGALGRTAGQRRHEDLRLEPGGHDERRLADLGRQDAPLHEERVRVEGQALVARTDLLDDAADPHRPDARARPSRGSPRRRAGGTSPRAPRPRTAAGWRPRSRGRARPARRRLAPAAARRRVRSSPRP